MPYFKSFASFQKPSLKSLASLAAANHYYDAHAGLKQP
jgi:hypothetical protein